MDNTVEIEDIDDIDITMEIGQLYQNDECTHPMYSFDRPAYLFWNGVAKGLIEKGLTKEEALEWLQSKLARWEMDGRGHEIEEMGKEVGLAQDINSVKEYLEISS